MFTTFTTTIFFIRVGRWTFTLQLIYTHFVFSTYIQWLFRTHITHQMIQWEIEAEFFFVLRTFGNWSLCKRTDVLPETGVMEYTIGCILYFHMKGSWFLVFNYFIFQTVRLVCSALVCIYICFVFFVYSVFHDLCWHCLCVTFQFLFIQFFAIFIYTIQFLGRVTQIMPFLITCNFLFILSISHMYAFFSQCFEFLMAIVIYISLHVF